MKTISNIFKLTKTLLISSLFHYSSFNALAQISMTANDTIDLTKKEDFLEKTIKENNNSIAQSNFMVGLSKDLNFKTKEALKYYKIAVVLDTTSWKYKEHYLKSLFNNSLYNQTLKHSNKLLQRIDIADTLNHKQIFLWNLIGRSYTYLSDYNSAIPFLDKTLAALQKHYPFPHQKLTEAFNNIGWLKFKINKTNVALDLFQKALQCGMLDKKTYYEEISRSHNNIGEIYLMQKNYKEARKYFQEAIQIIEVYKGKLHPILFYALSNIGKVYLKEQNFIKSIEFYNKALHLCITSYGRNHINTGKCYQYLGEVYLLLNKITEAKENLYKAEEIFSLNPREREHNLQETIQLIKRTSK